MTKEDIVNEGFSVAQQFLTGKLKHVSIDIMILQKILDDDFSRDLFVLAFNDEIFESNKLVVDKVPVKITGENNG